MKVEQGQAIVETQPLVEKKESEYRGKTWVRLASSGGSASCCCNACLCVSDCMAVMSLIAGGMMWAICHDPTSTNCSLTITNSGKSLFGFGLSYLFMRCCSITTTGMHFYR